MSYKSCNVRKSKKHPNSYTKKELTTLLFEERLIPYKTYGNKKSKEFLCDILRGKIQKSKGLKFDFDISLDWRDIVFKDMIKYKKKHPIDIIDLEDKDIVSSYLDSFFNELEQKYPGIGYIGGNLRMIAKEALYYKKPLSSSLKRKSSKLKLRKSDCIKNRIKYEWRVGKGCYELIKKNN